jgi:poly(3-hydroxyalkanoate) depolymerase
MTDQQTRADRFDPARRHTRGRPPNDGSPAAGGSLRRRRKVATPSARLATLGAGNPVPVLGQHIRVTVQVGTGVPLVLCNGIGASLEVLDPLVAHLNPDTTVVRFDAPGNGGSPASPLPYGFPYLAAVLGRLLKKLGFGGPVDVLGLSWGGALAQQFAFQHPRRCRRLILVSTGTGAVMVPAKPPVLAKMMTPRRFLDPDYNAAIAGDLYGGTTRLDPTSVKRQLDRQLTAGTRKGYLHQLLAGSVWTSVFALPVIRQDTLIISGTDDPIIPVANARIMARLLPHATLHLHSGGHVDLLTNAAAFAPVIEAFRNPGTQGSARSSSA